MSPAAHDRDHAPIPARRVTECWNEALTLWDTEIQLGPPQSWRAGPQGHWQADEPLAYIDLGTREVVVNLELLARIGASGSLMVVLAHEIGHHIRFPHTLGVAAAIASLEKRLIPGLSSSLTNLFFDLLVNEAVGRPRHDGPFAGRALAQELAAVYRGFVEQSGGKGKGRTRGHDVSLLFFFYLTVYEELWSLEAGHLAPQRLATQMERERPGLRSDARVFVQTFYDLPDVYLQFTYFCSVFIRYITDLGKLDDSIPLAHDMPQPDADDWDGVVRGFGSEQVERAIEEAKARGWLKDSGLEEGTEADPLTLIERLTRSQPGTAQRDFREALVAQHYKRLAERHLIPPPPTTPPPEPVLPGPLQDWEWGDSPGAIDWTGSVLGRGALAAVTPLRRELLHDDPAPHADAFPALEIYLDTSGSMPNPAQALNAMTLAAQILALSALRHRGSVRAVVYSSGPPLVSEWLRDEDTALRTLLHYAGGGTDYPFDVLQASARLRDDVIRIVISDSDFFWNLRQPGAMEKLQFATERSRLTVALLRAAESQARETLAPLLGRPRFRLALVQGVDQFATVARDLASALFPRRP